MFKVGDSVKHKSFNDLMGTILKEYHDSVYGQFCNIIWKTSYNAGKETYESEYDLTLYLDPNDILKNIL